MGSSYMAQKREVLRSSFILGWELTSRGASRVRVGWGELSTIMSVTRRRLYSIREA